MQSDLGISRMALTAEQGNEWEEVKEAGDQAKGVE